MKSLTSDPGTYGVLMELEQPTRFRDVGKQLHDVELPMGFYVYVGSAFGGLRARVEQHLGYPVNNFWNVDFVRPAMIVREVWFTYDLVMREHPWAKEIFPGALGGKAPVPFCGSWDCHKWRADVRCPTHLFHFPKRPSWRGFCAATQTAFEGHAPIGRVRIPAPSTSAHSFLHYCAKALRGAGCPLQGDEEAEHVYEQFCEHFHVDPAYPVVSGHTRDKREVFVWLSPAGEVWTLDQDRVCRPRDWKMSTLVWSLALPGNTAGTELVEKALEEGLQLLEDNSRLPIEWSHRDPGVLNDDHSAHKRTWLTKCLTKWLTKRYLLGQRYRMALIGAGLVLSAYVDPKAYFRQAVAMPALGKVDRRWRIASQFGAKDPDDREKLCQAGYFSMAVENIARNCNVVGKLSSHQVRRLLVSGHPRLSEEVIKQIGRMAPPRQRYALQLAIEGRNPLAKAPDDIHVFDTANFAEVLSRLRRAGGWLKQGLWFLSHLSSELGPDQDAIKAQASSRLDAIGRNARKLRRFIEQAAVREPDAQPRKLQENKRKKKPKPKRAKRATLGGVSAGISRAYSYLEKTVRDYRNPPRDEILHMTATILEKQKSFAWLDRIDRAVPKLQQVLGAHVAVVPCAVKGDGTSRRQQTGQKVK